MLFEVLQSLVLVLRFPGWLLPAVKFLLKQEMLGKILLLDDSGQAAGDKSHAK